MSSRHQARPWMALFQRGSDSPLSLFGGSKADPRVTTSWRFTFSIIDGRRLAVWTQLVIECGVASG
jgi:hypothetical protein